MNNLLFGRWQEKSIEKSIDLNEPGVYVLKAKTFGLKGFLGGTHSWVVYVDFDGQHLVAEVTDLETLKVQNATNVSAIRFPKNDKDQLVFISNREGGQKWFGSKPIKVCFIPLNKKQFHEFIISYPLANKRFHFLLANCNTFSSWVCYCSRVKSSKVGIGSKSHKIWKHKDKYSERTKC